MVFLVAKAAIIAAIMTLLGLFFLEDPAQRAAFMSKLRGMGSNTGALSCPCCPISQCPYADRILKLRFCGYQGMERKICCDIPQTETETPNSTLFHKIGEIGGTIESTAEMSTTSIADSQQSPTTPPLPRTTTDEENPFGSATDEERGTESPSPAPTTTTEAPPTEEESRKLSPASEAQLHSLQKEAGRFLAAHFPDYYNELVRNLTAFGNVSFVDNVPVPKDWMGGPDLTEGEVDAIKELFDIELKFDEGREEGGNGNDGLYLDEKELEAFLNISRNRTEVVGATELPTEEGEVEPTLGLGGTEMEADTTQSTYSSGDKTLRKDETGETGSESSSTFSPATITTFPTDTISLSPTPAGGQSSTKDEEESSSQAIPSSTPSTTFPPDEEKTPFVAGQTVVMGRNEDDDDEREIFSSTTYTGSSSESPTTTEKATEATVTVNSPIVEESTTTPTTFPLAFPQDVDEDKGKRTEIGGFEATTAKPLSEVLEAAAATTTTTPEPQFPNDPSFEDTTGYSYKAPTISKENNSSIAPPPNNFPTAASSPTGAEAEASTAIPQFPTTLIPASMEDFFLVEKSTRENDELIFALTTTTPAPAPAPHDEIQDEATQTPTSTPGSFRIEPEPTTRVDILPSPSPIIEESGSGSGSTTPKEGTATPTRNDVDPTPTPTASSVVPTPTGEEATMELLEREIIGELAREEEDEGLSTTGHPTAAPHPSTVTSTTTMETSSEPEFMSPTTTTAFAKEMTSTRASEKVEPDSTTTAMGESESVELNDGLQSSTVSPIGSESRPDEYERTTQFGFGAETTGAATLPAQDVSTMELERPTIESSSRATNVAGSTSTSTSRSPLYNLEQISSSEIPQSTPESPSTVMVDYFNSNLAQPQDFDNHNSTTTPPTTILPQTTFPINSEDSMGDGPVRTEPEASKDSTTTHDDMTSSEPETETTTVLPPPPASEDFSTREVVASGESYTTPSPFTFTSRDTEWETKVSTAIPLTTATEPGGLEGSTEKESESSDRSNDIPTTTTTSSSPKNEGQENMSGESLGDLSSPTTTTTTTQDGLFEENGMALRKTTIPTESSKISENQETFSTTPVPIDVTYSQSSDKDSSPPHSNFMLNITEIFPTSNVSEPKSLGQSSTTPTTSTVSSGSPLEDATQSFDEQTTTTTASVAKERKNDAEQIDGNAFVDLEFVSEYPKQFLQDEVVSSTSTSYTEKVPSSTEASDESESNDSAQTTITTIVKSFGIVGPNLTTANAIETTTASLSNDEDESTTTMSLGSLAIPLGNVSSSSDGSDAMDATTQNNYSTEKSADSQSEFSKPMEVGGEVEALTNSTTSMSTTTADDSTQMVFEELEATTTVTTLAGSSTASANIHPLEITTISTKYEQEGGSTLPPWTTTQNLSTENINYTSTIDDSEEKVTESTSTFSSEDSTGKVLPEETAASGESSGTGSTFTEKTPRKLPFPTTSEIPADFAELFTPVSRRPMSSLILDVILGKTTTPIPKAAGAEDIVSLSISIRGNRSFTLPEAIDAAKHLGGEVSNVVSQLLLTSHPNFHLLPTFTQCATSRRPKKFRFLHLQYDHLPHIVRIGRMEPGGIVYSCSGTLISKKYVLSSAQCLKNDRGYNFRTVLIEDDRNKKMYASIDKIVPHPAFSSSPRVENDIALVRLRDELDWDGMIRPLCLPFEDAYGVWDLIHEAPGDSGMLSGWVGVEEKANNCVNMDGMDALLNACEQMIFSRNFGGNYSHEEL